MHFLLWVYNISLDNDLIQQHLLLCISVPAFKDMTDMTCSYMSSMVIEIHNITPDVKCHKQKQNYSSTVQASSTGWVFLYICLYLIYTYMCVLQLYTQFFLNVYIFWIYIKTLFFHKFLSKQEFLALKSSFMGTIK